MIPTHLKKYIFRIRLAILSIFLIFIVLYKFYFSGTAPIDALNSILDSIFISLAVIIVTDSIVHFTNPPESKDIFNEMLLPGTIASRTRANAETSEWWEYVGHLARHTRSTIVPILEERGKATGYRIRVNIVIISPFNADVCRRYMEHLNKLKKLSRGVDFNDVSDIQAELMATIIFFRD